MKMIKRIAFVSIAAVVASATAAPAGTKYATNLVVNQAGDPPVNPLLSPKSSIKLDDKGKIAVSLAGVTDGAGTLVTTSGSFNDTGALDATTYVVIIKLRLPAIEGLFPIVEFPVPVDLSKGKGKTKYNAGPLFALIPNGSGRTVEITGAEVWGPMGGGAAACDSIVNGPLPVIFPPDMTCRNGDEIGMSGLAIPPPPAP